MVDASTNNELAASQDGRNAEVMTWSPEQLNKMSGARELEIAVRRADGTLRRWTPIWVVRVNDEIYVRTWYRRSNGWFGEALRSKQARIRVTGVVADVEVEDIGVGPPTMRTAVDVAYRTKYGDVSTKKMIGDDAAATTLRLFRD